MANAIGIDLGGTYIKSGIVGSDGNIVYESIRPTGSLANAVAPRNREASGPAVLDNVNMAIAELIGVAASRRIRIEGIGIGAPGIVVDGIVTACGGNVPELEGLALGREMEEIFRFPVLLENDANLMGLAETRFGAAKGMTDVVFLTVGTGIGGTLVLNGKLYGGFHNRGTELGHIRVASPGKPCTCGGSGCLEAHASLNALGEDYLHFMGNGAGSIPADALAGSNSTIDGRFIISRFLDQDEAAVRAMNEHFDWLASGIATLINIFSPQKVIIGGGIADAGEIYIRPIRERALRLAMKETSVNTRVEGAQLGNKAGFLGAAAIVFDSLPDYEYASLP